MVAAPAHSHVYDDPNTPLRPRNKLQLVLKKLQLREKNPPKGAILPLTEHNLQLSLSPDKPDFHHAFLAVCPERKVSVQEWLQLLP